MDETKAVEFAYVQMRVGNRAVVACMLVDSGNLLGNLVSAEFAHLIGASTGPWWGMWGVLPREVGWRSSGKAIPSTSTWREYLSPSWLSPWWCKDCPTPLMWAGPFWAGIKES